MKRSLPLLPILFLLPLLAFTQKVEITPFGGYMFPARMNGSGGYVRFQGDLLMPIQASGFTLFVGTGGAGGGLSLYGSMVQVGVNGGLILRLGHISN